MLILFVSPLNALLRQRSVSETIVKLHDMHALRHLLKISENLRNLLDFEDLRAVEIDEAHRAQQNSYALGTAGNRECDK